MKLFRHPRILSRALISALTLLSLVSMSAALRATVIPSSPADSGNVRSLDGVWRFKLEQGGGKSEGRGKKNNNNASAGGAASLSPSEPFYKIDYKEADGWGDLKVPGNWEMAGLSPATYNQPDNASGFYRLWFEVPEQWRGKIVKINFDGVQNGAEIWLNGQPVKVDEPSWGRENYHESGWTAFQADLTPLVKFGAGAKNLLAVRVTKNTRSVDLDTGDYFFLGGIHRSVTLFCVPQTHLEDFTVQTRLLGAEKAEVRVIAKIAASDTRDAKDASDAKDGDTPPLTLTAKLDAGTGAGTDTDTDTDTAASVATAQAAVVNGTADLRFTVDGPAASRWSAEFPNLHDLTLSLRDANGREIDSARKRIGIREVTIKNAVLLLNGVPVKLAGICRHDVSADEGAAVGPALWRKDIEMMKAANINAIRTSHYPYGSAFYDLCDELGMYVIDELPYCWASPLTTNKEQLPAFLQRARETIRRDKNHPCVLAWTIGNENKPGANLQAVADLVKTLDDTRPRAVSQMSWDKYHTELSDSHYTTPAKIRATAREAAANGHPHIYLENPNTWEVRLGADAGCWDAWAPVLQRCWAAVMASDSVPGTFLWEWQDRAIADKSPTKPYDYFEKTGIQLVKIKGLVDAYRNPRPWLYDVKNIYSPIQISAGAKLTFASGASATGGATAGATFEVENRYSFKNLSQTNITWHLLAGEKELASGPAQADIAPRSKGKITVAGASSSQAREQDAPATLAQADALRVDFADAAGHNIISHQFTLRAPAPREMSPTLPAGLLFPRFNLVTSTTAKSGAWKTLNRAGVELTNVVYSGDGATQGTQVTQATQTAPATPATQPTPPLTSGLTMDADLIKPAGEKNADKAAEKLGHVHAEFRDGHFRYRVEWSGPKSNVLELCWLFTMPASYDRFSWKRQARWTIYPPTHIGRPTGVALPDTMDVDYTKITRPDAFDFNSTKYDCDWAALEPDDGDAGLMVRFDPASRHHCRAGRAGADGKGGYTLAVNKQVSPPQDISSNVVPELYLALTSGATIESSFDIGSVK